MFEPLHNALNEVTTALPWGWLLNFRPPVFVQSAIAARGCTMHRLEDAYGAINLDYYTVLITRLPYSPTRLGEHMLPDELLQWIRVRMTGGGEQALIDPDWAVLSWWADEDLATWVPGHLGTVMNFLIRFPYLTGAAPYVKEDALVVLSEFTGSSWIFSTLNGPWPGANFHPVSGNRQFGILDNHDGTYTFYTRGADRITTGIELLINAPFDWIFDGGDVLWRSLQARVTAYVNSIGGEATVGPRESKRHDWEEVKRRYFDPPRDWIE